MLTDIQCRTAKPKDKPYKLPDGKGLYLEMKPNGVKAWRYRFELREGGATKESVFAIVSTHMRPVAKWRKTRKRDYANATRRRSPVLQLLHLQASRFQRTEVRCEG